MSRTNNTYFHFINSMTALSMHQNMKAYILSENGDKITQQTNQHTKSHRLMDRFFN